ncbi:MAG TPA: DUF531 family protein [Thermoplasmata archaeon]|jgi:hypothetical protein|nr:DUF531 family protein [Thermoplasmata archaeon]
MSRGRLWIGLYNSYDPVKFHEAHRRALARAGPVALAYDANLATFGFPYGVEAVRTPVEIAQWVAGTTSIGEDGRYLIELATLGRFHVFDFPKKGFPPQLGTVVVTTNHPASKKSITAKSVAGLLSRGTSVCLVFGLGHRGIEDLDVYDSAEHHLDITAKGLSLETATALGAVPAAIAAHLER